MTSPRKETTMAKDWKPSEPTTKDVVLGPGGDKTKGQFVVEGGDGTSKPVTREDIPKGPFEVKTREDIPKGPFETEG
jgi:hypothetical protein